MNQMTQPIYLCTSCSKEKSSAQGLIPAIDRYDSERIQSIGTLAKKEGKGFLILSGEYGLIDSQHPIQWYDHLLSPEEIEAMVEKVAARLQEINVETLVFYGADEGLDSSWQPYWEVIRKSTKAAGVKLTSMIL